MASPWTHDSCVTSRANLNKSYFTDRQDRYLHFSEAHSLSQYCFDFLKTVAPFTFRLLPSPPTGAPSPHSYLKENYYIYWPDPQLHPHKIQSAVKSALTDFQASRTSPSLDAANSQPSQALIFPVIQGGQFGIREEEDTFRALFQAIQNSKDTRPLLDLTSGYFSLYQPYQEMILSSRNLDCRIVAASPQVCLYTPHTPTWVDIFRRMVSSARQVFQHEFQKAIHSMRNDLCKP